MIDFVKPGETDPYKTLNIGNDRVKPDDMPASLDKIVIDGGQYTKVNSKIWDKFGELFKEIHEYNENIEIRLEGFHLDGNA